MNWNAFRSKNYRLFFSGQILSQTGTWMTQVTTIWLVYQLTNSALLLGIVGFAGEIPSFILAPFAGVVVDRWNRHRILIITQALGMSQSLALAFLTLTETINIWHIIFLNIFQGSINAFDTPTRHALVTEFVKEKKDLSNAIALNALLFNLAQFIGPALAGVLIPILGAGLCYLIDSISYIAIIAALFAMKIASKKIPFHTSHPWQRLKEGFSYTFGFPYIRSILILLALVILMAIPYRILGPIFATQVLHSGPNTFGFLMASAGVGALMASVYLSLQPSHFKFIRIIAFSPVILGMALIAFSLFHVFWFSLLAIFLVGFSLYLQITSSNTVLQIIVDDSKRGRVMSFYTMTSMGIVPFANLFAGQLANKIGASNTLIIGGVFCILGAFIFAKKILDLKLSVPGGFHSK